MKIKRFISVILTMLLMLSTVSVPSYGAEKSNQSLPQIEFNMGSETTVNVNMDALGEEWEIVGPTFLVFNGIEIPCSVLTTSNKIIPFFPDTRSSTFPDFLIKQGKYPAILVSKSETRTVKSDIIAEVVVKEDMQKPHVINCFQEIDGNSDIILHFNKGAGPLEIKEITEIGFWAVPPGTPDENEYAVHGFYVLPGYYSYDIDKGEIRISKDYLRSRVDEFGWEFMPYIYFGTIEQYNNINGDTIYDSASSEVPVPVDEFVNDGRNFWCLKINMQDKVEIATERYEGKNRYETATAVADSLKESQGINKFRNIIVANGENYADALAGSYLAKVKDAPILVVNKYAENYVKDYIDRNLDPNGKIYILGGEGAVSRQFEISLAKYNVKRLGGHDRFETNINILKESNVNSEDLLICSAWDFADSLSASSVGKPILLVDNSLSTLQKNYLNGLLSDNYYLIGGEGAVSKSVKSQLEKYGEVTRVSGSNRYATAQAVAEKFFPNGSDTVVIASGNDFPDGLTGGPLAMTKSAPLFLVNDYNTSNLVTYITSNATTLITVVGGKGAVSEKILYNILQQI